MLSSQITSNTVFTSCTLQFVDILWNIHTIANSLFITFNTLTPKLTRTQNTSVNLQVLCGCTSITMFSIISNYLCERLYSVGLLTNHLFSLHTCNLWNTLNATSLTLLLCITYCPSICGLSNILHSSPKAAYLTMHSL